MPPLVGLELIGADLLKATTVIVMGFPSRLSDQGHSEMQNGNITWRNDVWLCAHVSNTMNGIVFLLDTQPSLSITDCSPNTESWKNTTHQTTCIIWTLSLHELSMREAFFSHLIKTGWLCTTFVPWKVFIVMSSLTMGWRSIISSDECPHVRSFNTGTW